MLGFDLTALGNIALEYRRLDRGTKSNIRQTVSTQPTIVLIRVDSSNSLFMGYSSEKKTLSQNA
jgi:hypothetical protein